MYCVTIGDNHVPLKPKFCFSSWLDIFHRGPVIFTSASLETRHFSAFSDTEVYYK